jgi:hypothetical protein
MAQADLDHPSRSICYGWRVDIDILFDFRSETLRGGPRPGQSDLAPVPPIALGKPLQSGEKFDLEDARPGNYVPQSSSRIAAVGSSLRGCQARSRPVCVVAP